MDRSVDLFLEQVGSFTCLWDKFCTLGGRFGLNFGVIFVALGRVLATLGSLGVPKGGRLEKATEKMVLGSFVGPPRGSLSFGMQINQKSRKSLLEIHVGKHCARSAAQEVSWEPLQP